MSIWEKVFKNPKSKAVIALGPTSLIVPDIELPKPTIQFPVLFLGLALGTTYTKRTFLYQQGTEVTRWAPQNKNEKWEFSVFRIEKVLGDLQMEIAQGEEALSNFLSDRSEPPCSLFFQPSRFLLTASKLPSYVTTYEGQKILYQSPSNKEIYQHYIRTQLVSLWNKAHASSVDMRFKIGQIVVEYPDYFTTSDLKRYRDWFAEVSQEFFPPSIHKETAADDIGEKFLFLPESVITLLHWITDHIECKLAAQDLELKKLLARYGILPKVGSPINFLIVTMGATNSRVVKLRIPSIEQIASARKVGETVTIGQHYLGRTGFGGDHISCEFLNEEEKLRYGTTAVHRVSTMTRKVFEDWNKMAQNEGKKHFDELMGKAFSEAIDKLGDLTIKGFSENPENTIIIMGGKVFDTVHLRDIFRNFLQKHRVPAARISSTSSGEIGIERVCEISQFHRRGLGRLFNLKSGLEMEGAQRFTWKIGKVVEGTLVDSLLEPDNKKWDTEHPREFTLDFSPGMRKISLGYQKAAGGLSSMWANVGLKERNSIAVQVTLRTEAPDDLKIVKIKAEGNATLTADDFQVEMLIAGGEPPSVFPLCDKLLKMG